MSNFTHVFTIYGSIGIQIAVSFAVLMILGVVLLIYLRRPKVFVAYMLLALLPATLGIIGLNMAVDEVDEASTRTAVREELDPDYAIAEHKIARLPLYLGLLASCPPLVLGFGGLMLCRRERESAPRSGVSLQ